MSDEINDANKSKKPFYKKAWFIILVVILVLVAFSKVSEITAGDPIKQNQLMLGEQLPEFPKKKGSVTVDNEEHLSLKLKNISKDTYYDYASEVKKDYSVDSDSSSNTLTAFNNENFRVHLYYYESSKELSINVDAPKKLNDIAWPNTELVNSIPVPKSLKGEVSTEQSDGYAVFVGNTSKSDYDAYVNECMEKGYNINYHKGEKSFSANNEKGYKLTLEYRGGNTMYLYVNIPKEETSTTTETTSSVTSTSDNTQPSTTTEETPVNTPAPSTQETPASTPATSTSTNGISKEFKDAMDAYESAMNEYIEFMEAYEKDSSNVTLLGKYASMLKKYSDATEAFEKYDDNHEMTAEETKYYLDVQNRISKKLIDVSQ
ncbi:MAG: hypothetical protein K6D97_03685 [Clostridia bacterium]|nr:hypothetical protein [Clostridia bacterium]